MVEKTDHSLDEKANFCDSTGILKSDLFAEVFHLMGDEEWILRIADSARIAQYTWMWRPAICDGIPDSLKQHGLELVVSYTDKSRLIGDTALYLFGELLSVKSIMDFPEEDPRNSENMGTFYVKNIDGSDFFIDAGVVFRTEAEWNEFLLAHPNVAVSREIDFETQLLVGQVVSHGGCGWIYRRSFEDIGSGQFIYKVTAEIYGNCQAMQRTYHWVTVPKTDSDKSVLFEFEEILHADE